MLTKASRIGLSSGLSVYCGVLWLSTAIGVLMAVAGQTTMLRGFSYGATCGLLVGAILCVLVGAMAADLSSDT